MKHIFKSFNFSIVNYKDAERFLNDMASKGYKFISTGFGDFKNFAVFEKNNEAKQYRYAIDVKYVLLDDEKERYYGFYKEIGWKNIGNYDKKLHIFVVYKKSAFPLYIDQKEEVENLNKGLKNKTDIYTKFINILIYLILARTMVQQINEGVADIVLYGISLILFISAIYNILIIINYFSYSYKCKKSLKNNGMVPQDKIISKLLKVQCLFTITLLVAFHLIAILGYIYEIYGAGLNLEKNINMSWQIFFLIGCVFFSILWIVASYFLFLHPKQLKLKTLYYSAKIAAFILCCISLIQIIN